MQDKLNDARFWFLALFSGEDEARGVRNAQALLLCVQRMDEALALGLPQGSLLLLTTANQTRFNAAELPVVQAVATALENYAKL